jgi:hypothetical protein
MTHMTQLQLDLLNNASERLRTWIADTRMRCDAVDLPIRDTMSTVISCLIYALIRILIINDISKQIAHNMIDEGFKRFASEKPMEKKKV